jgi:precorrin-2/cobalt-factor-2 C20-methyltransferase
MPATLEADILRDRLAVADAAIIIKLGRHFAKIKSILQELNLFERALYIERATLPDQVIKPIASVVADEVPYWAIVMIPSETNPQ